MYTLICLLGCRGNKKMRTGGGTKISILHFPLYPPVHLQMCVVLMC